MDDPPRFTGAVRSGPADEAAARLVGVPAALHQRRRGSRQRRRDPRQPARSHRQPARSQHAGDRGDPGVAAARRRQHRLDPAVRLGTDIRLPRSRLCRPGRGAAAELYDQRTLLFVTLPVVFSAWQAILAVILGIMWVMRRHEPAYGVLAAAMAVGVVQAFLPTPMGETPFSRLNAILIASAPLESGAGADLRAAVLGWKWPRYGWIIFVPGLLLALAGLFGNQAAVAHAVPGSRRADGRPARSSSWPSSRRARC